MKMNQNLRDFSDRFFFVRVLRGTPYDKWQLFERYEDASRFQKELVYVAKKSGQGTYRGFPINQYITLSSRPNAYRRWYETGEADIIEDRERQALYERINEACNLVMRQGVR